MFNRVVAAMALKEACNGHIYLKTLSKHQCTKLLWESLHGVALNLDTAADCRASWAGTPDFVTATIRLSNLINSQIVQMENRRGRRVSPPRGSSLVIPSTHSPNAL